MMEGREKQVKETGKREEEKGRLMKGK